MDWGLIEGLTFHPQRLQSEQDQLVHLNCPQANLRPSKPANAFAAVAYDGLRSVI